MRLASLLLAFVLALVGPAAAQQWPALTGRVVDGADLLSVPARRALEARLAEFEEKSSDQLVVATITSLNGAVLEDYANGLFRHWQLGQARENNGVLLLVAFADRKIRIEVGYGPEGTLTDALSRVIIETTMVPAFRQGDFEKGIIEGATQIVDVLSGDAAELEAKARRNDTPQGEIGDWVVTTFVVLWFGFIFISIVLSTLAPFYGRRVGPGRYRWLGIEFGPSQSSGRIGGSTGGSWSSGGGGFSGGGGSSGGGGASGGW